MAAVMLPGCGAKVAPEPQGLAAAPSIPAVQTEGGLAPGAPSAQAPSDPAPTGPAAASDEEQRIARQEEAFRRVEADNRGFKLMVRHACLRHGEAQQVDVETWPMSNVSLIVGYEDGQPHGAMFVGQSGPTGRYTWRFPVSATAPQGPAIVLGSGPGHHETGEGGGSAHGRFRVAGPEGC